MFFVQNIWWFFVYCGGIFAMTGDHICHHEESFVELEQTKTTHPVKIRNLNWCLNIPPRCSNYRTETKDVVKLQNITKTRLVEHCCEGYTETREEEELICKPICRGGCGKGYCQGPNHCICDIGYTGKHCTQRCRYGMWGENCKKVCRCRNGALCNNKNGSCRCNEGWTGDHCNIHCPPGFYGMMCRYSCECSSNKCHPQSGDCMIDDSQILFNGSTDSFEDVSQFPASTERIEAKQWISVNKTLDNSTIPGEGDVKNLIKIHALNSTIANLTENMEKLSKEMQEHKKLRSEDKIEHNKLEQQVSDFVQTTSEAGYHILVSSEDKHILINSDSSNNLETTEIISEGSENAVEEVLHVVGDWNINGSPVYSNHSTLKEHPMEEHRDIAAVITAVCVVFIVIIIIGMGAVYTYSKASLMFGNENSTQSETNGNLSGVRIVQQPLPKIPTAVSPIIDSFDVYDRAPNNTSIEDGLDSYNYITEDDLVSSSTSYSRKNSFEHFYDEIRYPTVSTSRT